MELELTVTEESTIMDNLDIFRKNGFHFLIDENAPMRQRVKLVSIPFSKNKQFGVEGNHASDNILCALSIYR